MYMSLTKSQFDSEHEGLLQEKYDSTIENIKQIQDIEKYMYKNLEIARGKGESDSIMQMIQGKINDLVTIRKNLYNQLSQKYKESAQDLNNTRNDLSNQFTIVSLINDELDRLHGNYKSVSDVLDSKKRMVEISNYEEERYKSYNHLMLLVVIMMAGVFIIYMLNKNDIMPNQLATLLLSIIIGVSLIFIVRQVIYMSNRSNFNYNDYVITNKPGVPSTGHQTNFGISSSTFSKDLSSLETDLSSLPSKLPKLNTKIEITKQ